tara:strand:- start:8238 stop:9311 length:1074 start_codon:yes stop_codon:yes gene_type:complete
VEKPKPKQPVPDKDGANQVTPVEVQPLVPHRKPGCIGMLFGLACWVVALVGWAFALVAILHFPDFAEFQKIILGSAFGLATFAAFLAGRGKPILLMIIVAAVAAAFYTSPASPSRTWAGEHEYQGALVTTNDTVVIEGFRNFKHDPDDQKEGWTERTIDPAEITGVDFFVQPFMQWNARPEILISFTLSNGPPVSVSIEARREEGEEFNPLNAVFRQLELIYVIGHEKDFLGALSYQLETPVYLLRSKLTAEQARALFDALTAEAKGLIESAKYFNPIWRNSTAILARHLHELGLAELKPDWRMGIPGHADEWLLSLGLIDFEGDIAAAREKLKIQEVGIWELDHGAWSEMIRGQVE